MIRGHEVESTHLSNNRIAHPFLRKLTDQKVAYLLAKPFTVQTDDDLLLTSLEAIFTKDFLRMFQAVARDAIVCGCGWLSVYYDENGVLKFRRLTPENTAAIYNPNDLDQLDAVVRRFQIEDTLFYEVWTTDGVETWKDTGKEFESISKRGHFTAGTQSFNWDKIPLIPFKYNPDALPLICFVKDIIDNYDQTVSDVANILQDTPDAPRIVQGYSGDIEEFVHNFSVLNTVFVGEGGAVQTLQPHIDVSAYDTHLNRLRKDLYESGSGVDSQETSAGNLSGTAIRFRYSDLDLDCQRMGNEFSAGLETVAWFVCEDMKIKGQGEHTPAGTDFIWNTDHIINEAETVQILNSSKGLISDETLLANHPYVTSAAAEQERIKAESGLDTY